MTSNPGKGFFDVGPLFGKRVLVTRPAHQAGEFAASLIACGAQPILAPTIAIGTGDTVALDAMLGAIETRAWAVFTSRNSVDSVFERLDLLGRDARIFARTKIAAIGPRTARALAQRGIRADLVPEEFVGEAAARALVAVTSLGDRIAIFGARDAPDTLPAALNTAKRLAKVVSAYTTSFVDEEAFAAKVADADVLTFASASSVAGFGRALGGDIAAAAGKVVACIGPVTAQAATDLGLHVDVVARSYTGDGLIAALLEFLASAQS